MIIDENKKLFYKEYDSNKNQVLFFSTKVPFPFSFSSHTFMITNKKGIIHRWEVWGFKHMVKEHTSNLYRDLFIHPWDGIMTNFFFKVRSNKRNHSKNIFLGKIENDIAKDMIKVIYNSEKMYKFSKFYFLFPGPNCNSYTQWILNQFPKVNIKLPNNAIGK
jgi:hypothetical protein